MTGMPIPVQVQASSFRGIVSRLAADGGELLRQLAVEHEREVSHLHSEIAKLQETISHFTGAAPPEVQLYPGPEVDAKAANNLSLSGKDRHRQARKEGNNQASGKPDENALAKAFAFVDSIHDDRVLMQGLQDRVLDDDAPLEVEDTSRVLKIAAEIADYAREQRDHSREQGGRVPPTCSAPEDSAFVRGLSVPQQVGPGGPPLVPPTRPLPAEGMRELRSPADRRELINVRPVTPETEYTDYPGQDLSGHPGIKLSNISPPVKAPDRLPEPPSLPDDDETTHLQPMPNDAQVLDERLQLDLPRVFGPAAAAYAGSLQRECAQAGSPRDDQSAASGRAQAASSRSPEAPKLSTDDEHGGEVDFPTDSSLKSVPVFIKAVSKPENEALSKSNLSSLEERYPGFQGSSPIPSRETTTWQALLEAQELESPRTSENAIEIESPSIPAAEGGPSRNPEMQVPSEDWRSLLQVQGSKWRPSLISRNNMAEPFSIASDAITTAA